MNRRPGKMERLAEDYQRLTDPLGVTPLVTHPPPRGARPAAVSASTVFAIALAIVAGLIFAWLFKMVLLDKPKVVKPPDDSVEITVAATNVYDQMEIKSINVKKVRVSPKERDTYLKSGKTMLIGNQPIGRVAKVPISAERPFYEEDLYPFAYPESVNKKLRPGWRAAIITLPAKEAMVQVGDYVDVYATLSNDALGPGGNGTAEIAKGAQVIARFGTTRPGAQPVKPDAPREYTLEVTPYRYALIELARTVGAKFSFTNAPTTLEGDKVVPPPSNDINDPREQVADRVSGADLAALFGIGPPGPAGPPPWSIEKYVGIHNSGSQSFPGYVPPSRYIGGGLQPSPSASGTDSSSARPNKAVPVAYTPLPRAGGTLPPPPIVPTLPPPAPTSRPSFPASNMVASSARSFGFAAPKDPSKAKGCAT
jgi:Flp pilus assembly protein CpaB